MHNIQVFLSFANFYWHFIQNFNKIAGSLISMIKATNRIGSSIVLQLLIDTIDEDEVGESGGNKTNLSNPFASKNSIKAGYLTSKGIKKGGNNPKKGGDNTKKGGKAAKSSDYLASNAKKAFTYL